MPIHLNLFCQTFVSIHLALKCSCRYTHEHLYAIALQKVLSGISLGGSAPLMVGIARVQVTHSATLKRPFSYASIESRPCQSMRRFIPYLMRREPGFLIFISIQCFVYSFSIIQLRHHSTSCFLFTSTYFNSFS